MGWKDTHAFRFEHGGKRYGIPDPNAATSEPQVIHAKTVRLSTLLNRGQERFDYLYDFGDNWQHDIVVEDCRDGEADINYPALVDGAGRCPPEDVGGTSGFEVFLEAMAEPDHPEHSRLKHGTASPSIRMTSTSERYVSSSKGLRPAGGGQHEPRHQNEAGDA